MASPACPWSQPWLSYIEVPSTDRFVDSRKTESRTNTNENQSHGDGDGNRAADEEDEEKEGDDHDGEPDNEELRRTVEVDHRCARSVGALLVASVELDGPRFWVDSGAQIHCVPHELVRARGGPLREEGERPTSPRLQAAR
jgi:hypothetical protein